MGLYDLLYRHAIFPWLDRDGVLERTRRLEKALESPRETIERMQSDLLQGMCNHAATTSPFWHDRFARFGIDPSGVRGIADLAALPLLEKDDVRRDLARVRSSAFSDGEVKWSTTGGSTAAPMPFVRDRECLLERAAGNWLVFGWMGRRPWHRAATIWGAPRDLAPRQGFKERWGLRLRSREIVLPSNALDEQQMAAFASRMLRFHPDFLHGYARSVALFASFIRKASNAKIDLSGVSITAETITGEQRRLIGETFGCRVVDIYGSREFGYVAASCEKEPVLHINPLGSIVEVVRPDGSAAAPDEPGQIIITDLLNRATPFLRYRTGDIGTLGQGTCPCGRPMRWMKLTAARETDFVVTPERRLVSGVALAVYVSDPGIAKIQFLQERLRDLEVVYVKTPAFTPATLPTISLQLSKLLGETMQVSFREASEIPLAASGKYICSMSKTAQRYFRGEPIDD